MAYTNGESDRNTEAFDAPSDGPDGYREEDPIECEPIEWCRYCTIRPAEPGSDYCGANCRIDAENDR